MTYLAALQSGIVRSLAADLRSGGLTTLALAFMLGAIHALTPGHGKAALAAYFLGTSSNIFKGVRVALSAALLHVVSGLIAFLILRFVLNQAPSITGRGAPTFTILGYGFVVLAGLLMLAQTWRPQTQSGHGHSAHALTLGVGLLPCPLTISVLGFAWLHNSAAMITAVLLSLAAGIAATIGSVALAAILAQRSLGATLITRLPDFERKALLLQRITGAGIALIGLYMILTVR